MLTKDQIFELAKEARSKSYSPYSHFAVGACIVFDDDSYVLGCNIENASYGLANCAERTAMFSAIAQGYDLKKVKTFAIIADCARPVSPCGACRQVMAEFLNKDTEVILFNLEKDSITRTVEQLLPYSFEQGDLNE